MDSWNWFENDFVDTSDDGTNDDYYAAWDDDPDNSDWDDEPEVGGSYLWLCKSKNGQLYIEHISSWRYRGQDWGEVPDDQMPSTIYSLREVASEEQIRALAEYGRRIEPGDGEEIGSIDAVVDWLAEEAAERDSE